MTFFSPRGVLVFVYKYGINMKARKILLVFLILYGDTSQHKKYGIR